MTICTVWDLCAMKSIGLQNQPATFLALVGNGLLRCLPITGPMLSTYIANSSSTTQGHRARLLRSSLMPFPPAHEKPPGLMTGRLHSTPVARGGPDAPASG